MTWLVLKSWLLLLYIEFVMRFFSFQTLHAIVRRRKVRRPRFTATISVERLCHAIDLACVFYFKRVLCLQRSSATALLLRRYGRNAEMVIGAQIRPFRSHAWVELEGRIVNDPPYMPDTYQVLERC